MIQAITWALVPTSGAGMSLFGPIRILISVAYRRVSRSSSPGESCRGSHVTPPLAPPNGRCISADFQVIHMASARTSLSRTSGLYRIPPLVGPRTGLWCTRYPVKMRTDPSSIPTGKCTTSSRCG